jgi:hypothetical protein
MEDQRDPTVEEDEDEEEIGWAHLAEELLRRVLDIDKVDPHPPGLLLPSSQKPYRGRPPCKLYCAYPTSRAGVSTGRAAGHRGGARGRQQRRSAAGVQRVEGRA